MLCSPLSSLMIPTLDMAKVSSRRGSKSTILTTPLNSMILQKPTGTFKTWIRFLDSPYVQLGLPERCENADFFTSNNIDDRHYMILIILSRLQRPACEAPPDNATELSSRTCSFSGLLELLRSSVYQDFCSTALATSLYALIVHQSA